MAAMVVIFDLGSVESVGTKGTRTVSKTSEGRPKPRPMKGITQIERFRCTSSRCVALRRRDTLLISAETRD